MAQQEAKRMSSTERVYEAVQELRSLEQIATRVTVAELTGLKQDVVDDRLRALVDNGRLSRLIRGVYEVVDSHPPARAISKTLMPDGSVKLEVGDEILTLTPREDRILATILVGAATQAIQIETVRQFTTLMTSSIINVEKANV